MSMLEDIADKIAKRALETINKTGNDTLEAKVKATIGSSSPTLEEAFSTAMRIRRAEERAMEMLERAERGEKVEAPKISSQPQDDISH